MAYFYSLDREAIKYRKIHGILSLVILHKAFIRNIAVKL